MDNAKCNNDTELTSTMGNVLSTSIKEEKSDTGDAIPTSSTDANTSSTSSRIVSDDPISSTSSDVEYKKPLIGCKADKSSDEDAKVSSMEQEADLLEMNMTEVSAEKITEDVEDLVHDLESLLGEPTELYIAPTKEKKGNISAEDKQIEHASGSDSVSSLDEHQSTVHEMEKTDEVGDKCSIEEVNTEKINEASQNPEGDPQSSAKGDSMNITSENTETVADDNDAQNNSEADPVQNNETASPVTEIGRVEDKSSGITETKVDSSENAALNKIEEVSENEQTEINPPDIANDNICPGSSDMTIDKPLLETTPATDIVNDDKHKDCQEKEQEELQANPEETNTVGDSKQGITETVEQLPQNNVDETESKETNKKDIKEDVIVESNEKDSGNINISSKDDTPITAESSDCNEIQENNSIDASINQDATVDVSEERESNPLESSQNEPAQAISESEHCPLPETEEASADTGETEEQQESETLGNLEEHKELANEQTDRTEVSSNLQEGNSKRPNKLSEIHDNVSTPRENAAAAPMEEKDDTIVKDDLNNSCASTNNTVAASTFDTVAASTDDTVAASTDDTVSASKDDTVSASTDDNVIASTDNIVLVPADDTSVAHLEETALTLADNNTITYSDGSTTASTDDNGGELTEDIAATSTDDNRVAASTDTDNNAAPTADIAPTSTENTAACMDEKQVVAEEAELDLREQTNNEMQISEDQETTDEGVIEQRGTITSAVESSDNDPVKESQDPIDDSENLAESVTESEDQIMPTGSSVVTETAVMENDCDDRIIVSEIEQCDIRCGERNSDSDKKHNDETESIEELEKKRNVETNTVESPVKTNEQPESESVDVHEVNIAEKEVMEHTKTESLSEQEACVVEKDVESSDISPINEIDAQDDLEHPKSDPISEQEVSVTEQDVAVESSTSSPENEADSHEILEHPKSTLKDTAIESSNTSEKDAATESSSSSPENEADAQEVLEHPKSEFVSEQEVGLAEKDVNETDELEMSVAEQDAAVESSTTSTNEADSQEVLEHPKLESVSEPEVGVVEKDVAVESSTRSPASEADSQDVLEQEVSEKEKDVAVESSTTSLVNEVESQEASDDTSTLEKTHITLEVVAVTEKTSIIEETVRSDQTSPQKTENYITEDVKVTGDDCSLQDQANIEDSNKEIEKTTDADSIETVEHTQTGSTENNEDIDELNGLIITKPETPDQSSKSVDEEQDEIVEKIEVNLNEVDGTVDEVQMETSEVPNDIDDECDKPTDDEQTEIAQPIDDEQAEFIKTVDDNMIEIVKIINNKPTEIIKSVDEYQAEIVKTVDDQLTEIINNADHTKDELCDEKLTEIVKNVDDEISSLIVEVDEEEEDEDLVPTLALELDDGKETILMEPSELAVIAENDDSQEILNAVSSLNEITEQPVLSEHVLSEKEKLEMEVLRKAVESITGMPETGYDNVDEIVEGGNTPEDTVQESKELISDNTVQESREAESTCEKVDSNSGTDSSVKLCEVSEGVQVNRVEDTAEVEAVVDDTFDKNCEAKSVDVAISDESVCDSVQENEQVKNESPVESTVGETTVEHKKKENASKCAPDKKNLPEKSTNTREEQSMKLRTRRSVTKNKKPHSVPDATQESSGRLKDPGNEDDTIDSTVNCHVQENKNSIMEDDKISLPDSSVTTNSEATRKLDSTENEKEVKVKTSERPKRHKKSTPEKLEELSINIDVPDKEKLYSPKITIKPIKAPEEDVVSTTSNSDSDVQKGSLKMTITKQSDKMHSILKICDSENSEVTQEEEEPIPKLKIKSIVQPVEQHSPKMSTRSSKHLYSPTSTGQRASSPRITIKIGGLKPEEKLASKADVCTSPKKVIIKPIVKPVEESEQVHSPRITIKPIPKPESEKEPPTTVSKSNAKNSKKNDEEVTETEKGRSSPKVTIKPVVKPQSPEVQVIEAEEEVKERIVLKINKGNLPTPMKDNKKREHVNEDEKSEKWAKITVKFSKEGGHPHIVQQSDDTHKRSHEEQTPEKSKKQKVEVESSIAARTRHNKDVAAAELNEAQATKHKDPAPECPVESKKLKLKDVADEISPGDILKSKLEDDEVHIIENKLNSPIVISEDSRSQDSGSCIIIEDSKDSPISMPEVPKEDIHTSLKSTPVVQQVPTPPSVPRKRGRPRKVPLEVREDFKEQDDTASHSQKQSPSVHESGRPKRSCRGQSARDALGIKPRKPRGPGRGRGGKRGLGNRAEVSRSSK